MSFFLGLGAMVVLWLGSRDVISGRITLGQFVAFFAYLTMLAWPMIAFGWVTNMLQRGMASWKRMLEVLDTVPAIKDEITQSSQKTQSAQSSSLSFSEEKIVSADSANSAISASRVAESIRGEIEFRNLTFSYGKTRVLQHVSARIAAGQTVAIVGPTGSGKSTLISLLARLHDPPPGTVFLDGVDVRLIPLATLRGAIGFVPQEPFLFSDTIADNVAFGLDANAWARGAGRAGEAGMAGGAGGGEASAGKIDQTVERRKAIEAAAAVARLDKDLVDFPHGYDTVVG